ncbi:MAG: DUF3854 domain-containing protein, partial [Cyanobacteriota bacterium]
KSLKPQCYQIDGIPHLLITEGAFKAISACSHGLPTIALLGVEMGLTSTQSDPQGKRYLIPSLEKYARAGFGFILAFDADSYTNFNVRKAQYKLGFQLEKFGCNVLCLPAWDGAEGKGIDDYIQLNGINAFHQNLLSRSISFQDWCKQYFSTDSPKVDWQEPQSYGGTIGYWRTKGEDCFWEPRCNFDFTIERELTSENGGGFIIQLKPETEERQYSILLRSEELASPESFVDAIKRSLGFIVVCSLTKRELNALVAAKQAAYRQVRGGKKYRICDRYGQQKNGVWVFSNLQFTPEGEITNEHETLTVFDRNLGKEDYIPCPKLAEPNGLEGLKKLVEAGRKVFLGNFHQFLLTIGWVVAGVHFQTIQRQEGMFPILDAHGNPGSGKTLAAEAALSLIGTNWDSDGMVSKVSLSAVYELLSRTGSLPVIWDDPPLDKHSPQLDTFCQAMWNAKPRRVRGNHQEPKSPIGFTTNHQLGGEQPAAYTRFARIFFCGKGDALAIPELKQAQKIASGSFQHLIKIGYDGEAVKKIQQTYLPKLSLAHERISWSLALITWYVEKVLELVGGTENIQQWVIDNLLTAENDAENSGDCLVHFIQCIEALESKDAIGSWNKRTYTDADGVKWMAIFATNVWSEVNKTFSPSTYNQKSLKAHILKNGGQVDKTVKFHVSRDEVLDYQRERRRFESIEEEGEKIVQPKPPRHKTRRAWLLPIDLFPPDDDDWENSPPSQPPQPDNGHQQITENFRLPISPEKNVTDVTQAVTLVLTEFQRSQEGVTGNVTDCDLVTHPQNLVSGQPTNSVNPVTKSQTLDARLQENVTSGNPDEITVSTSKQQSGHKVTRNSNESLNFSSTSSKVNSSQSHQTDSTNSVFENVTNVTEAQTPNSSEFHRSQPTQNRDVTNCDLVTHSTDSSLDSQSDCQQEPIIEVTKTQTENLRSQNPVTRQNPIESNGSASLEPPGHKVTENLNNSFVSITPSFTEKSEIDYSSYPHLTSNDARAKEKQANACKQAILACHDRRELSEFRETSGFTDTQIRWVWHNLLNPVEKEQVRERTNLLQLGLFDEEESL